MIKVEFDFLFTLKKKSNNNNNINKKYQNFLIINKINK